MSNTNVLVVGAGPTGLMMACELARHGAKCRIIDKAAGPSVTSKALAVHARTLEILQNMGAVEGFLAEGIKLTTFGVYADHKRLVHLQIDELDSPYSFSLGLPQADTERLLTQHLAKFGLAPERGVELTSLEQSAAGVKATLRHTDGSEEVVTCDWLVAADGAHSTARKCCNVSFSGTELEEHFIIADVTIEWPGEKPEDMTMFTAGDHIFATITMPKGQRRVISAVQLSNPLANKKDLELSDFQCIADAAMPGVVLKDPTWISSFRVRYRHVPQYRIGRVFLAGDAAHIHSPAGGQGMNTGLQDSYNLAWKLALVSRGIANESLLDSYHDERHGIAVSLLKATDMLTRVNIMRNPISRHLRNKLAPFLVGQEVVQQRIKGFLSETHINYRKSPIVSERRDNALTTTTFGAKAPDAPDLAEWLEFSHGPQAGDRAPDAVLEKDGRHTTLYDVIAGTKHNLLIFCGHNPDPGIYPDLIEDALELQETYGDLLDIHIVCENETKPDGLKWSGSILFDPELSLHHKYGAGSECLYLIRPDGYIGFRSQPAEPPGVHAYFNKILSAPRRSELCQAK